MAALRKVQDPEIFKDIVTLNMVKDVNLDGDNVR
jgi:metal-sulfur cluster biosynthetic enzyme